MSLAAARKPDFLIIGAQKAGTTWLWRMLEQHPGVALPEEKEIHFFGSAELYRRGLANYYRHFADLRPSKRLGEASTSYFYDRLPFWYNESRQLEVDLSLPSIPELVTTELPDVKILVVLRDPVARAISAYFHWLRDTHWSDQDRISPLLGLKETALRYPKLRILEYGYYAQYLRLWMQYVPQERLRVLVFEEDVCQYPQKTIAEVYRFLDLDPDFEPEHLTDRIHQSWSWTRILLTHYADPVSRRLFRSRFGNIIDRFDVLGRFAVDESDIEFLRAIYLPQRPEIEALIDRSLGCWKHLREPAPAKADAAGRIRAGAVET